MYRVHIEQILAQTSGVTMMFELGRALVGQESRASDRTDIKESATPYAHHEVLTQAGGASEA